MKKNNYKGFYEDEESLKMMEAIHNQYVEERVNKFKKKESKKTVAIIVLAVILVALVIGFIMVKVNAETETLVNQCVADGSSLNYCKTKYYM